MTTQPRFARGVLPLAATERGVRRTTGIRRALSARGSHLLLIACALLAVGAVGVLQVLQTSSTTGAGYELRQLDRERSQLSADIRLLEADVASSARLEQVRERAVTQLGMTEPKESLRVAVSVPPPAAVPLPERYVQSVPGFEAQRVSWWERWLRALVPGS